RVTYQHVAAAVTVSPPLTSSPAADTEPLLAARGHQVQALLIENGDLLARIGALEAAAPAAMDRRAAERPPEDAGDELLPPPALARSVGGEFRATGAEFLRYFIELGGLRPTEHVLDVGCGVGRMAVPLTGYLDAGGRYE